MRRAAPLLLFLPLVLAPACDKAPSSSAAGPPAPSNASSAQPASTGAGVDVGPPAVDAIHEYTGGATAGDGSPIIIAIHGLGDNPSSFSGLFRGFPAKAHFILPAGGLRWGDGFAWWPIQGRIDEKSMADGIAAATERLAGAIPSWRAQVSGRPIITGFSQGGMLSFAMAAKHPELVGEAVPVAGLLPASMLPAAWPAGAPMPRVFALHGDADTRVPFALGQKAVEGLRALGLTAELKPYSGVQHTISAEMRRDWLAELSAAASRAAGGQ